MLNKRNPISSWEAWVRREPEKALEHASKNFEGTEREEKVASGLRVWARSSPSEAAAWLDRAPAYLKTDCVGQELIQEWAVSQPEAAANWVTMISDKALQTSIAETLAAIWAKKDGERATRWLQTSFTPEQCGIALHLALDSWAESNPDGMQKALASLEQQGLQTEATKVYAAHLAESDGMKAWQFAGSNPDNVTRLETSLAVMETWADISPSQAANAIDELESPEIKTNATSVLAAKWIISDRALALQWLARLPKGEQADAGYTSAVEQLAANSPREAFELSLKINGQKARQEAIDASLSTLISEDPASRDWLARQKLPDDVNARLERYKTAD